MTTIWPPARILAMAGIVALLLVAATYLVAIHQPWLGVVFEPAAEGPGLVVGAVHSRSRNPQLNVGDVVMALAAGGREEALSGRTLSEGDNNLSTFAIFNQFVEHHRALWEILKQREIEFVFADGRRATGWTSAKRKGSDLSWQFWFLAITGVVSFLISVAIWACRREQFVARLMLVAASGFMYAALLAALHYSRELTLPPFWLYIGIGENNVGMEIAAYSVLALLWYYPAPLSRFPAALVCALAVAAITGNEMLQWVEWPGHAYVMQYPFVFAAMAVLAVLQWRKGRRQALSRASLQWFLLTILVCAGSVALLFFIPTAYSGKPLVPAVSIYLAGPLFYLGLAFGIVRYRLFDLERWWLEMWLWLGGGLLVIGIDVLLLSFLELSDMLAFGFALILAGWAYLPLRQWLFRRALRRSRTLLDDHIPLLVETLFRAGPLGSFGARWRELVERVFAPMALTTAPQPASQAAIAESGLAMRVPAFDGNESFELRFREQGRRLYTPRDAALADSLLALTRRAESLWRAGEDSARVERRRILRDLHDDVGARLLTLAQLTPGPSTQPQAREALGALRDIIYALDDKTTLPLQDLLNELEAQVRERARLHGIEVIWKEPETIPDIRFGAREHINLQRIIAEAVSNAIRHGAPTRFMVRLWMEAHELHLHFCNDGSIFRMEDWIAGKGMTNIRNRIHELGGAAHWNTTGPAPRPVTEASFTMAEVPATAMDGESAENAGAVFPQTQEQFSGENGNSQCCLELRIPLPGATAP